MTRHDIIAWLVAFLDCDCDFCAQTKRYVSNPAVPLAMVVLVFLGRVAPLTGLASMLPPDVVLDEEVRRTWRALVEAVEAEERLQARGSS